MMREWVINETCLECGKKTIPGYHPGVVCTHCGWKSDVYRANQRVNEICNDARQRMDDCKDGQAIGRHPAIYDWMTDAEKGEMHKMRLLIIKSDVTQEEFGERVRRKRKARKENNGTTDGDTVSVPGKGV